MLKLPAELTIAKVAECKEDMLKIIDENNEIILDDSAVVRIDTIGLQMLLATVTYITAQNKSLQWKCQSDAIKDSVKLLGLDEPILNQYLTS
jgi:anti-anti-sigma regulatory factor